MAGKQPCLEVLKQAFLILAFSKTNILLGSGKECGIKICKLTVHWEKGFQLLAGMCCATLRFFFHSVWRRFKNRLSYSAGGDSYVEELNQVKSVPPPLCPGGPP